MEILVLGNGFDLAHKLPTQYRDFLHFVKVIKQMVNGVQLKAIDWGNINLDVKKLMNDNLGNKRDNLYSQVDMWKDLVEENFWIDYFIQNESYIKENWIDFESEISKVIQDFDSDLYVSDSKRRNIKDEMVNLSNSFLRNRYEKYTLTGRSTDICIGQDNQSITYEEIRDNLYRDLQKLIRALEIYLVQYVEKLDVQENVPEIERLKPDHILSFNYTDTYKKFYDKDMIKKEDKYDFIHGKTDISHTIENCNLVLGIDEYLPKKRRDKEIEFVSFKKYYQRIYKETGSRFLNWIERIEAENKRYNKSITELKKELKENHGKGYDGLETRKNLQNIRENRPKHHIYIFGHSLDVTDKDILKSLICCDNVYTQIYYYNDTAHAQQVANLVKVIGEKELIKRTGGPSKTIEFIRQQ